MIITEIKPQLSNTCAFFLGTASWFSVTVSLVAQSILPYTREKLRRLSQPWISWTFCRRPHQNGDVSSLCVFSQSADGFPHLRPRLKGARTWSFRRC